MEGRGEGKYGSKVVLREWGGWKWVEDVRWKRCLEGKVGETKAS